MSKGRKIFILGFVLFVLYMSLPWALVGAGKLLYSGSPDTARLVWRVSGVVGFYGEDVSRFNIGDTFLRNSNYLLASQEFSKVIDITNDHKLECASRYNLAQSFLRLGDEEQDLNNALNRYLEAQRALSSDQCFQDPEFKKPFEELLNLINSKIKETEEKIKSGQEQKEETKEDSPENSEEAEEYIQDDSQEEQQRRTTQNRRNSRNSEGSDLGGDIIW